MIHDIQRAALPASGTSRFALLACAGGIALAFCQYLVFVYAPVEAYMGIVQKIFYFHVPLAWWAFISFGVTCIGGIFYLRTRHEKWDHLAHAAASLGLMLCSLALVTGSVWARHSWGVWWTWDPRLTTALILWFLYAAYIVLRHMDMSAERQATVCAVVGIAAFVDVPLVFLSARLWRSIHPAVFASEGGGLEPEMLVALLASLFAFGLLWVGLLGLHTALLRDKSRLERLTKQHFEDD